LSEKRSERILNLGCKGMRKENNIVTLKERKNQRENASLEVMENVATFFQQMMKRMGAIELD
jgi:hypothetical protein